MTDSPGNDRHPGDFLTTRWSRVRHAKSDSEEGKRALADLCEAYYEPVVVFLRYQLRDPNEARDTAHAFFAEMLSGGTIRGAYQERGRFRSYLLGALKHFLSNERAARGRLKRGGGAEHLGLDDTGARSIADGKQATPDLAYDRQWATTLLGHALDTLRAEYAERGRSDHFERLKPWLTGEADHGEQQALAMSLGMNLNTLKSDISRLKHRFQNLVKAEIAGTVADDEEVQEELEILFAALRSE